MCFRILNPQLLQCEQQMLHLDFLLPYFIMVSERCAESAYTGTGIANYLIKGKGEIKQWI